VDGVDSPWPCAWGKRGLAPSLCKDVPVITVFWRLPVVDAGGRPPFVCVTGTAASAVVLPPLQ
jgi:hypothetical protein